MGSFIFPSLNFIWHLPVLYLLLLANGIFMSLLSFSLPPLLREMRLASIRTSIRLQFGFMANVFFFGQRTIDEKVLLDATRMNQSII